MPRLAFFQLGILLLAVTVVLLAIRMAIAQTPTADAPPNPDQPVLLGQPCTAPYVVAIPGSREELLDRVQAIVSSAFISDSQQGLYIQAGASERRSTAERLSRQLRRQGFDARVSYRPLPCFSSTQ